MAILVFTLWAVIMFHCCLLSIFALEKNKPGTVPYSDSIVCASNCAPYGMYAYCCCMVMTILLLIYLFKYVINDDN